MNRPSLEKQFGWRSLNEDDADIAAGSDWADVVKFADGDNWRFSEWQGEHRTLDSQDERPESTLLTGTTAQSLPDSRISNESSILFARNTSPTSPSSVVGVDVPSIFFACNLSQLSSTISNESLTVFGCSSGMRVNRCGSVTDDIGDLSQELRKFFDFLRSWQFVTAVWYRVRLLPRRRLPWHLLGNGWDVE